MRIIYDIYCTSRYPLNRIYMTVPSAHKNQSMYASMETRSFFPRSLMGLQWVMPL